MRVATDSLRFRFLVSTLIWIGFGIFSGGLLVSAVYRWNLIDSYHQELNIHLEELAALTELDSKGQPYLVRRMSDPRYLPKASGFYWQVERKGHVTLVSPSLGDARLKADVAVRGTFNFMWTQGPYGETLEYGRLVKIGDGAPPLRLLVASDKWLVDEAMANFNQGLIVALSLFAALMIAGGVLQFTYGLQPLGKLGDAIKRIGTGEVSRMEGTYPTEIRPLINNLNSLLDAKDETAARSRVLASNLAHGLRTPLSILIFEAENLRNSGNYAASDTILAEAMRMQKQIDFHLARARAATAQPAVGQAASLQSILMPMITAIERLHQGRDISFDICDAPDVAIACDAVDLSEILANLLDNSAKWAASSCFIAWSAADRFVHIIIDDDGNGLEPHLREAAFQAGQRLDELTPGTGLGLAISRDLARIYGGDVNLSDSRLGGLRATVVLPLAGRARAAS